MRRVVLCLLLAGLLSAHGLDDSPVHVCVHDTKFKDHKPRVMEEVSKEDFKRLLQIDPGTGLTGGTTSGSGTSSAGTSTNYNGYGGNANVNDGWHPIRILMDYTYANRLISGNPSLNSKYEMAIRLVESVRSYWMNALQVNFMPIMRFSGGSCYNNKIPAYERPIDLFITIYPENDPSTSYFAAATPCYLSSRDGRPTIGAYILNFAFLKATPLNEYLYFSTFAHEFTHILGFSNDLFDRYVDGSGNKRGTSAVVTNIQIGSESFTAIKLPEVLNYAVSYFGCSAIQGVPLENNGGEGSAGSHWEKLFLPQEYMNPTVENPGILSEFTMSLLRGTGWYQVDRNAAQYFDWGKGAGCGVFQICPSGGTGYCSPSQSGQSICSSEWYSKGSCTVDTTFSSGCAVKRSKEHTCLMAGVFQAGPTEYYGPGARCLNYNSGGPKCHAVQCGSGGVQIKIGSNVLTCTSSMTGQPQSTPSGDSIICPDVNDFCTEFSNRCNNDCSANGLCISGGICQCYTGWSGSDCSTKVPIDYAKITAGGFNSAGIWSLALSALVAVLLASF